MYKELHRRIEGKADRVLDKADNVIEKVGKAEGNFRGIIKKATTVISGIIIFIATFLGYFGIKTYIDIKEKINLVSGYVQQSEENSKKIKAYYEEISLKKKESEEIYNGLRNIEDQTKELIDITLNIRRLYDDSRVEEKINMKSMDELRDVTIKIGRSKDEIYEYIKNPEDYNYMVSLEAIKNFMKLVDKGDIELNSKEMSTLNNALLGVLKKCNNRDWRTQLNCRNLLVKNTKELQVVNQSSYNHQIKELRLRCLGADQNSRYKWNLVIVLSYLGKIEPDDLEYLAGFIRKLDSEECPIKEPSKTWLSCISAIHLINNTEIKKTFIPKKYEEMKNVGWQVFAKKLRAGKEMEKAIAVLVLSDLGRAKLVENNINQHIKIGSGEVNTIDFLIDGMTQLEKSAKDKYSKAYYAMLTDKLRE
jgi:hypothetical protein